MHRTSTSLLGTGHSPTDPHHMAHNLIQAHTMGECTHDSPQSCNSCIFLHLSEQRVSQAAGIVAQRFRLRRQWQCFLPV